MVIVYIITWVCACVNRLIKYKLFKYAYLQWHTCQIKQIRWQKVPYDNYEMTWKGNSRRVVQSLLSSPSFCLHQPAQWEWWAELAAAANWHVTWLGQAASCLCVCALPADWIFLLLFPLPAHKDCSASISLLCVVFGNCMRHFHTGTGRQSDFNKVDLWLKFTKQDRIN